MQTAPKATSAPSTTDELIDRWATFAFTSALLFILILTLFPFQCFVAETASRFERPFLLLLPPRIPQLRDIVLNILLFVPFGFSLACLGEKKKWPRRWLPVLTLIVSLAFSFAIEVLQMLMPTREGSWPDVLTNAIGGVVGLWLFRGQGQKILRLDSIVVNRVKNMLRPRLLAACYAGYLACVLLTAIPLQSLSHLSNWNPSYPLMLGNDATGNRPWHGHIFRIEIANRALDDKQAMLAHTQGLRAAAGTSLIASYQLQAADNYPDLSDHLPELTWHSKMPAGNQSAEGVFLRRSSWLETAGPATSLVRSLQQTNQFALEVQCSSISATQTNPASIVLLARTLYENNMALTEEHNDLVFRLRTPLTWAAGEEPSLIVPGVFALNQQVDLLVTYDGANVKIFRDGRRLPYSVELAPGAAIFRLFRPLKMYDTRGYKAVYYGLVFAPLGCLLALTAKASPGQSPLRTLTFGCGLLLAPVLLESVLVIVSGRPISAANLGLEFFILVGSFFLLRRTLA
jgi:glycopeptide antibiotics resistance protein